MIMKEKQRLSRLRFNFGYLLAADRGTRRDIELDYPEIEISEDVSLSPLKGKFRATRTSNGIHIAGKLQSIIETDCTRCLSTVALPIELELDEMLHYPPSQAAAEEYTIGDEGVVDLAPLVRELSLLEIPMQVFCEEACKGMCIQCGQNLNVAECDCVIDDIDPRFAALKALLEEDEE